MTAVASVAADSRLCDLVRTQFDLPFVSTVDDLALLQPWPCTGEMPGFRVGPGAAKGPAQVCVLQPPACDLEPPAAQTLLASVRARLGPDVWVLALLSDLQACGHRWLDAGADRVLPCDADPVLVAAVLRALVRRAQGAAASQTQLGDLRFDHPSATLFSGHKRVLLTARETQLAALFVERGQQVVRTQDIARRLATHNPDTQALVNIPLYVHRLNRKLRPYGLELACLRGYGYRLQDMGTHARSGPASALTRPGVWSGAGDAHLLASWPPHPSPARQAPGQGSGRWPGHEAGQGAGF